MMRRYNLLQTCFDQLDVEGMDRMWLKPPHNREIKEFFAHLEDLESVSKLLQRESLIVANVRDFFDQKIKMDEHPAT